MTRSSDLVSRLGTDVDEVVGGGGKADGKNLSQSKKSKNVKSGIQTRLGAIEEPIFLTSDTREAFNQLRQAFTKVTILRHFDLECHIWIETNALGYAIGEVLSQLTSDHLTSNQGQWHPVAYFLRKMIPAETRYKTHDSELLAIIEAFKTWRHYLEGCKYEVLVLTDHNILRCFINTKSLSSKKVRWAQKLSCYHFWIDYRQGKANGTINTLSQYPQQSAEEEKTLWAKNVKILHRLQSSLTNASLLSLSTSVELLPLHLVLICATHVFPQLRQCRDTFWAELAEKNPYKASIGGMRLRLSEL